MPDVSPETATLRAALDEAQRRTEAERTRRVEAETRLRSETGTRFAAQETAVETALSQAEGNAATLEQRFTALQEEGKFSEAARVMREMGDTTARIAQLKGQKDWFAQQKQQAAAPAADPLDRFNATERDWIARNPRYLDDPNFARKVNAAATYAMEFEGHSKDSPEYWQSIERRVQGGQQQQTQAEVGDGGSAGGQAPAGDAGNGAGGGNDGPLEQQHTMSVPVIQPSVDAPVMKINLDPAEERQPRAVGKGGGGMRAVAAPPSHRIHEVSSRLAGASRGIEPTQQEYDTAVALYDSIEPNAQDRSPDTVIRWYHALYHSPSHQRTRRRHWVFPEGSAT